jgi:protease I
MGIQHRRRHDMPAIEQSKILIIATDGFEQSELFQPRERLLDLGADVRLASPDTKPIQGMEHHEKGATITPDLRLEDVDPNDFDALVIPGGVVNPDALRQEKRAVDIVRAFAEAGKPVAAICHGPWLLVEADIVEGKTVTSWPSVRTDLANAGANVVDEAVAKDGFLITSRKPDDLDQFTAALIEMVESR